MDMEEEANTSRILEWYTLKRGKLAGEENLTKIDLMGLRHIFNVTHPFEKGDDEPYDEAYDPYMAYVYPVDEEKARALQPYVKHKIRLDKYAYFVASYARVFKPRDYSYLKEEE